MAKGNTLQAMLDRAKVGGDTPATPAPIVAPSPRRPGGKDQVDRRTFRPRGQHAAPHSRWRGGNDRANLLGEALDDLFVKKGRGRVSRGVYKYTSIRLY